MSMAAIMIDDTPDRRDSANAETDMGLGQYCELLSLVERLHRRMLDVLKAELDARSPIKLNAVQALLLHNIGDAELTAGELRSRGHYLGSNVSYNLKKLVELGYIHHERSTSDRRSVRVRLTQEGQEVRELVAGIHARQWAALRTQNGAAAQSLEQVNGVLANLEAFWAGRVPFSG